MTRKQTSISKVAVPKAVDDLKVIRGIGPLTEKHLQDGGICTFTQLAMQSPESIAACVPNLSANQIRKLGWVLQARRLTGTKTVSKATRKVEPVSTSQQHYQNFTLEFLLDDKNKIRRLRITHIQSGDVDSQASWCPKEISQFLARHTGARIQYVHPTPKKNIQTLRANEKVDTESNIVDAPPLLPAKQTISPLQKSVLATPPVESIPQRPIHPIRLLEWTNSLPDSQSPIHNVFHDKNFNVRLKLDIGKASLSNCTQLDITGMLYAKKLGGEPRQIIGEAQWTVSYSPIINLVIDNATLAQGIYRLEALVRFKPTEAALFPTGIDSSFQGGLLQVY